MDLNSLDVVKRAEDGEWMDLLDPVTGQALIDEETKETVSIQLAGADSKRFRRAQHETAQRRKNRRGEVSPEEADATVVDWLLSVTLSWRHIVVGESLPFSEQNARTLYTRFPWIREQVSTFIQDRKNYLGN